MDEIKDGGPAFPSNADVSGPRALGMNLRDYFAASALSALVSKAPLLDRDGEHGAKFDIETLRQFRHDMAVSAYEYADAMLRARQP